MGLALGRQARWLYLFRPGRHPNVVPTKNPGRLHHSQWRSSVFVEHFAQVWYTFFVFSAFCSCRYTLVSRQSICICSFSLLYHCLCTSSVEWLGLSSLAILLSHHRTQIRWADSVISILYRRFFVGSRFRPLFGRSQFPPPSVAPSEVGKSLLYLHLQSSFVLSHMVACSSESHSDIMWARVLYLLHIGHSALLS